jgi:TetR/AcrR family transcriptional regulator, regulator of mycofactocin system
MAGQGIRSGRPPTTSRDEVAKVALRLFVERGFEETTLEDVAAALGISRRTIFRYFSSKNDIVWGTFDEHLEGLRSQLADADPGEPLMEVLRRAVVAFNDYGDPVLPELRDRMTLITTVPALQGHSMLRYADWCAVIAEFVARRVHAQPDDHVPQVIAGAALGTAMASYRHWIRHHELDLLVELDRAFRLLAAGFDERAMTERRRER